MTKRCILLLAISVALLPAVGLASESRPDESRPENERQVSAPENTGPMRSTYTEGESKGIELSEEDIALLQRMTPESAPP